MHHYTTETAAPREIARELLHGDGAVAVSGLFTNAEIAQARSIVMAHSEEEAEKVTHFQGAAEDAGTINRQRRVWNLLAKGDIFTHMATHPVLMAVMRVFLGTEFIMGSIAANRILPNGPGQEPHVDYPYWDFYREDSHPINFNSSFPMNAQVSVLLDPFTEDSGATAYVPGSQKKLHYPTEADNFYECCQRMTGKPGDVIIFFGAAWHCAMPNTADHDRTAILIQYLPKWIKPLELTHRALPQSLLDNASDDLRQLLGAHYDYPEILDDARAGNTEGRL